MDSIQSNPIGQSISGQTDDPNEHLLHETNDGTIHETNIGQTDCQSDDTTTDQSVGDFGDITSGQLNGRSDDKTDGQPVAVIDDNRCNANSAETDDQNDDIIVDEIGDQTVGINTGGIINDQSDDKDDNRLVIDMDVDRADSFDVQNIDPTDNSNTVPIPPIGVDNRSEDNSAVSYADVVYTRNETNGLSSCDANNGIPINTDNDDQGLGTTSADNTQLRTPTRSQSTTGLPVSPTQEDLDSLNGEMFALAVNKLGTCGRNFGKWMTRFSNASAKCIEMASSQMSGRVSTSIDNFIAEPMDDTDVSMDQSGDESVDNRDTGNKRKRMNSGVQQNICNRCPQLTADVNRLHFELQESLNIVESYKQRFDTIGDQFKEFAQSVGPDMLGVNWLNVLANEGSADSNNLDNLNDSDDNTDVEDNQVDGCDGVSLGGVEWTNDGHNVPIDRRLHMVSQSNRAIKLGSHLGLCPDIIPTESGYLETISGSNQKVIQLYGHLTNVNAVKDKQRLFESYQKSSYMGWEVLTGRTVHQFVFFRLYSPCCPICGQCLATGPNSTVHDIHNHMKVKHYMMNTSTLIHAKLHIVS